jgi:hypothetical protein
MMYIVTMHHDSAAAASQAELGASPVRATRAGAAPRLLDQRLARYLRRARVAAIAAAMSSALGCASDSSGPGGSNAAGSGGVSASSTTQAAIAGASGAAAGSGSAAQAGAGKLSFANDIFPAVIRSKCSACHNDAPSFGGLAFFPGGPEFAYGNLVGVPSGSGEGYKCRDSGLKRVQPSDPEHSLIYLKLTNPPCGTKMPPAAFGQVTPEQVELVRTWIEQGAAP